ncbi:MAG: hypothetical protein NZ518_05720, partial [Dehalococcoidia bacterium]|nr:hypothetical protein [Dehalococcoidia bacterium]
MSIILGLRSKHDAAAALLIDGEIVAAASEERFRRQKHYFGFPRRAIEFCLAHAGIAPHEVDLVARDAISPRRAIARLARQPLYAWTPRLYRDVLSATVARYLRRADDVRGGEERQLAAMGFGPRRFGVEHHYGHAAYAYYATGWNDALVMVLDGRGHYLAGATYLAGHGALTPIAEIQAEGG